MNKPIKTRMAPSPTGNLHVGTARTALFNYLFARHMQGAFVLRIEDTDLERSDKKFETDIINGLTWLGIEWDEPIVRQTERHALYERYLEQLLGRNQAFYCQHTAEELNKERAEQLQAHQLLRHQCDARDAQFKAGIIRFRNDYTEPLVFHDLVRGTIPFVPQLLGDFSLAKSLTTPLYNFAVVVDDYEMNISHIIRGEDHISNTPKQLLVAEALGWARKNSEGAFQPPWEYAHLPLILGPDRSKLSKRHGATSVSEYRSEGYLADALFNFLTLLGWNPGNDQEIFSREELIKIFSLDRVQKAGAIFDITKLDWMNGEYIRKKSASELRLLAKPYFANFFPNSNFQIPTSNEDEYIEQILTLEQPRLKKLSELSEKTEYFFKEPMCEKNLLRWKSMSDEELKNALVSAKTIIENIPEEYWNKEYIESTLLQKAAAYSNRGELLWPLRVALSGKKASPGPFEIMEILGKQTTLNRIQYALNLLMV